MMSEADRIQRANNVTMLPEMNWADLFKVNSKGHLVRRQLALPNQPTTNPASQTTAASTPIQATQHSEVRDSPTSLGTLPNLTAMFVLSSSCLHTLPLFRIACKMRSIIM